MQCKNCINGLALKVLENTLPKTDGSVFLVMEPVACHCCGGYFEYCENCEAGKRVVNWVSAEDYDKAMVLYRQGIEFKEE